MIYTGYYSQIDKYENLVTVSIAGRAPEGYNGFQYKKLAPTWNIFSAWKEKRISDETYTERFIEEVLNKLDIPTVIKDLNNFGEDIILLCYERPDCFCHRHIVAQWLTDIVGIKVEEYKVHNKELF